MSNVLGGCVISIGGIVGDVFPPCEHAKETLMSRMLSKMIDKLDRIFITCS